MMGSWVRVPQAAPLLAHRKAERVPGVIHAVGVRCWNHVDLKHRSVVVNHSMGTTLGMWHKFWLLILALGATVGSGGACAMASPQHAASGSCRVISGEKLPKG